MDFAFGYIIKRRMIRVNEKPAEPFIYVESNLHTSSISGLVSFYFGARWFEGSGDGMEIVILVPIP
jgi:hypothetical protein